MRKQRHRARVARALSGGNGHGTKWRINLCVLAGSVLLLASVALLQLRLAIVGQQQQHRAQLSDADESEHLAVNSSTPDGSGGGKGTFLQRGERRGQKLERLWRKLGGGGESGSFRGDTEGAASFEDGINNESGLSEALEETSGAEEDEGDRFEELENEMDMEDEDGDESESLGGDVGEWLQKEENAGEKKTGQAADKDSRRLQEEGEKKDLGATEQQQNKELISGAALRSTVASRSSIVEIAKAPEVQIVRTDDPSGTRIRTLEGVSSGTQNSEGLTNSALSTKAGSELKPEEGGQERLEAKRGNPSTGVFSTDDEPIDEETRNRLEHMFNIEDVLMLNKDPSSSKKESWGRTQDSEASKKEKGENLSSDPLNPENIPLLQDPDSIGQGLTKNDRALLKAFGWTNVETDSLFLDATVEDDLKEVRRNQSFNLEDTSAKEPKSVHKSKEQEVAILKSFHSASDSNEKVLGESSLGGDSKVGKTNNTSEKLLRGPTREGRERAKNRKGREKGGKRAHKLNPKGDKRTWGYFPGLHSQLTFSGFMEEFLFDKKCSLRVFMAWMTPPWSFTVRHQRVLESLFHFHPTACVVVFSETMEPQFFRSFVEDGYRVAVVLPNLDELLVETPTDVFATIWMVWRQVDLFYIHYSELLRLAALYKYGGIYLDLDMIVMKPLTSLNNTIGKELLLNGQLRPNGAVMAFDKFSPFLNRSMAEFTATYDETLRDWNGAVLLDRVMNRPVDGNDSKLGVGDNPHMEPPFSFFPLNSTSITRYFIAPEDDEAIAEEGELLNQILSQSFTVHLWNDLTSKLIPEPGSLVEKLMERNCLHCTDIL